MITGTQLREFARSGSADEEQDAGTLTLSFINAKRDGGALSVRWDRHQKLAGLRHVYECRRVKTKEEHAGRELRCICYDNLVHVWHRLDILATKPTYFRNGIFNQNCDI
ncbi:MAG TPA: hypothetical protein VKT72_08700 [Candidatus Baltobacteraceae bacterium]|nr:hypothetical protein [Candidatus Baltobacteraceae bacterium]